MWLAERAGAVVGAVTISDAPDYVPATDVPELYVQGLVSARSAAGRGAGRRLLAHVQSLARAAGVRRVRVDCYAGDDGALVGFYRSAGFTPTERFAVGEWTGQLLERPVR
jgi:GNAT superfamily N-acetyltransferase